MPSIERPNAPTRIPSTVFSSPRFQQRASPYPSEALSSSSTSPSTQLAQRRNSKASPGHRKFFSESQSSPKTLPLYESSGSSAALDSSTLGLKSSSLKSDHQSRATSLSQPGSSTRSSISAKARKLLSIPPLRVAGTATKDGAPPRDPKHGFHWHHEISGHWLEIRIGKKDYPPTALLSPPSPSFRFSPAIDSRDGTSIYKTAPTSILKPSTEASSSARDTGHQSPEPAVKTDQNLSHSLGATGAFFVKAKRRLRLRAATSETNASMYRTQIGEMLERTSSQLRVIATKRSQLPSSPRVSPSLSNSSSQASSNNSNQMSKWHPLLNDFMKRDTSSTSSLRSNIQDKPPTNTPESQEMYTASDQQRYFRVEMADADGPNFLPSEAKRINTPPGGGRSKHRGWFFDHRPPKWDTSSSLETFRARRATVGTQDEGPKLDKTSGDRPSDWYDVQLNAIEAETSRRRRLVEEVPDHLPNSPLCPRNLKHKSGGQGTCSMHGRTERDSTDLGELEEAEEAKETDEGQGYRIQY